MHLKLLAAYDLIIYIISLNFCLLIDFLSKYPILFEVLFNRQANYFTILL
jgi:hypothetical protein